MMNKQNRLKGFALLACFAICLPSSASAWGDDAVEFILKAHKQGRPFGLDAPYRTCNPRLSEWLSNSGAYMDWISAIPVWYWPRNWTRVEYSNTYVPLGR